MELKGKRTSRTQGCGPHGWRYLVYNRTESLTNAKVNEIATSIMDKGLAVIPKDMLIEVEINELEGGLVEIIVTDEAKPE